MEGGESKSKDPHGCNVLHDCKTDIFVWDKLKICFFTFLLMSQIYDTYVWGGGNPNENTNFSHFFVKAFITLFITKTKIKNKEDEAG